MLDEAKKYLAIVLEGQGHGMALGYLSRQMADGGSLCERDCGQEASEQGGADRACLYQPSGEN